MAPRASVESIRLRQSFFFVVAIVLPCIVLVLLTWRMLRQERELGEKRVVDEQRRLVGEGRQSLLARLDRLQRTAAHSDTPLPPEAAMVAHIDNGRLILPWESAGHIDRTSAELQEQPFRTLIGEGERLEFAMARLDEAIARYRRARTRARVASQQAFADLLAARVLSKRGQAVDAGRLARTALALPPEVVDDQTVPLALYSARLMVESPEARSEPAVIRALATVSAARAVSPSAIYMARDIAIKLDDRELVARLSRRARDLEQALALRDAFPTLGLPIANEATPVWVHFGADPSWLISVTAGIDGQILTAIHSEAVLSEPPDGLEFSSSPASETLAPAFPTVRVALSSDRARAIAEENRAPRPFYVATLLVVVSVALFGAYLFWRDVQREIHVAGMRSQFVSSVSHELKTPLTAIRMFAETLLGRRVDASVQHEYLETIVNESERLTRLLNNVLDFSKIESGNKAYHPVPQALPAVVRGAARAMQYPFAQLGFDLRVAIDDNVPPVAVDADAIQQALLNLLSNAMKYSGESRVVEMSLSRDGDDAVIAVVDHGVGIAPEEQRRIFDKFYRVQNDATSRIAGTGLGLTLVEHVTRGHGGQVRLESAPGAGSRFAICLPIVTGGSRHEVAEVPA